MTDAPERIWLQPHMAADIGGWTWCIDQIEDDDVEYVRADLTSLHNPQPTLAVADALERAAQLAESNSVASGYRGAAKYGFIPWEKDAHGGTHPGMAYAAAIRALKPAPTDQLAAALAVPEVRALVEAAADFQRENDSYNEDDADAMNAWRAARRRLDEALRNIGEAGE